MFSLCFAAAWAEASNLPLLPEFFVVISLWVQMVDNTLTNISDPQNINKDHISWGMLAFSLHSDADAEGQGTGLVCVCKEGVGLQKKGGGGEYKIFLKDGCQSWWLNSIVIPEYVCCVHESQDGEQKTEQRAWVGWWERCRCCLVVCPPEPHSRSSLLLPDLIKNNPPSFSHTLSILFAILAKWHVSVTWKHIETKKQWIKETGKKKRRCRE